MLSRDTENLGKLTDLWKMKLVSKSHKNSRGFLCLHNGSNPSMQLPCQARFESFFFLLSFAVFLFSSLSYFLLSVPISTPALLLLSNSRKKSWVLTPPIEFLENGGPPLSWLPWMREEVVQVSQKNGLHYWVPSGRRIPVLSQPAHVPGDWPKTEFACDVAHSPECILKPLRRAGSRQCDSIPSPLATSRAEPEFSSKSSREFG